MDYVKMLIRCTHSIDSSMIEFVTPITPLTLTQSGLVHQSPLCPPFIINEPLGNWFGSIALKISILYTGVMLY